MPRRSAISNVLSYSASKRRQITVFQACFHIPLADAPVERHFKLPFKYRFNPLAASAISNPHPYIASAAPPPPALSAVQKTLPPACPPQRKTHLVHSFQQKTLCQNCPRVADAPPLSHATALKRSVQKNPPPPKRKGIRERHFNLSLKYHFFTPRQNGIASCSANSACLGLNEAVFPSFSSIALADAPSQRHFKCTFIFASKRRQIAVFQACFHIPLADAPVERHFKLPFKYRFNPLAASAISNPHPYIASAAPPPPALSAIQKTLPPNCPRLEKPPPPGPNPAKPFPHPLPPSPAPHPPPPNAPGAFFSAKDTLPKLSVIGGHPSAFPHHRAEAQHPKNPPPPKRKGIAQELRRAPKKMNLAKILISAFTVTMNLIIPE